MEDFESGPRRDRRPRREGPYNQIRSGNANERLRITSGEAVLLDQFMMGNAQFGERLRSSGDVHMAVVEYGGTIVPLAPGDYGVHRDPREMCMVIHLPHELEDYQSGESGAVDFAALRDGAESKGRVFVDTRCLVMIDRDRLSDGEFLSKFVEMRGQGADKEARDFVRTSGGAVRYGFSRLGDELGVYSILGGKALALWPDVTEIA